MIRHHVVVCMTLLLGGCDTPTARTPNESPSAQAQAQVPAISGTPEEKLTALAARYANGFVAASAVMKGSLVEGAKLEHIVFLPAGACHRLFAAGDEDVRDLDLIVHDPNAVVVQRDVSHDAIPMIGVAAPICPQQAGAYRVEVRMVEGGGSYALQLYQSPP